MLLAKEYQKNNVMTADGVGVIILLYDGVIDFNARAKTAIDQGNIESRNKFINKSLAIISELDNALDMERGGIISENLTRLYAFMMEELTKANINNDKTPLDTVTGLIAELRKGWEGIQNKTGDEVDQEPGKKGSGMLSVKS